MASASVEKEAILRSIALCNHSIEQYKLTARTLASKYREAGNGWSDEKYRQLGNVINDCVGSLSSPLRELEESVTKLNEILRLIEMYENENL